MSSEIAIKVENLSKCYHIYDQPRDRLKQMILPRLHRTVGAAPKQYFREFWALKDVSFEVKKGETVGIIGRNGSGKSTLLQVICGTLSQTSGSVITNGRIAALLELGSGFNPEFSGRENVYMSCALLGLGKEEIDNRFDDIAAFADIGDFIEQPVKTYSSGMFVRLAFAVNVISSPDIMVVDEALAVGDMNFQAKCMTALNRFQEDGGTVLFVSHDIGALKSLCSRGIYLEHGELRCIGPASEIAERYIREMRAEMNAAQFVVPRPMEVVAEIDPPARQAEQHARKAGVLFKRSDEFDQRVAAFRYGAGGARVALAELLNMDDQSVNVVEFNQKVKVRIHFSVDRPMTLAPAYYILDDKKILILGAGPRQAGQELPYCIPGRNYVATYTTELPLQEGNYCIQIQLNEPVVRDQNAIFLDVLDDAIVFHVSQRLDGRVWTKVLLPNAFELAELS